MEQFQGPGACLVVERIIQEGTDDASQEKGQSCLFVLEQYREGSSLKDQISEHIGYVKAQKLDKSIGQHFNNQEIHYQT